MSTPAQNKVCVIGLDCATPQFIWGDQKFDLPHIQSFMNQGTYGTLKSCDPPITIPAWSCMLTGSSPGELGVYGFRNRDSWDYDSYSIATSLSIRVPRIWDILSENQKHSIVIGVPQTFPPKPLNGWMVSGLLTPDEAICTYPETLQAELLDTVGDIKFDATPFRTTELDDVLERIYALMRNRFSVARHMLQTYQSDFFMMVEMGLDRLHHAFWKYCDPNHPQFEADNPYRHVFKDYYEALDAEVGSILSLLHEDDNVLIVSDHGAQPLQGGIRLNQWLINQGYLVLKDKPADNQPITPQMIDWEHTVAWGDGGYYGRIFLNLENREPKGRVPVEEYEKIREEIKLNLSEMALSDGRTLTNTIFYPDRSYPTCEGYPPDLIVYFDDLKYRSIGTLESERVYSIGNDHGPDGANHAHDGIWAGKGRGLNADGSLMPASIYDILPTLLNWFDLSIPSELAGHSLLNRDTLQ
jgi:predicted AlkP superfamily phosphohydrolase/phosphomutase